MNAHNSLVLHAKTYMEEIFLDLKPVYLGELREYERDKARMFSQLGRHGLRLVVDYLPGIAKHFDKCLDQGFYQPFEGFLGRPRKNKDGGSGPLFLGYLYRRIFDKDAKLRVDASIASISAIRQLLLGLKKIVGECSDDVINNEIDSFVEIERVARSPFFNWRDEECEFKGSVKFLDRSSTRDGRGRFVRKPTKQLSADLDRLHSVCDMVSAMLGDFHNESPTELPKHGPGAVSNLSFQQWKYNFPSWSDRIERIFPYTRYACANEALALVDGNCLSPVSYDSRLVVVPKTLKAPRLIAAEPVENQWVQQVILNQIVRRIAQTPIAASIRFNSQEANQKAAVQGSIDGSNATVDLSSASDRLSCWTVERVFRRNISLLERLHASRSQAISLKDFGRGSLPLKKFSTMGSACTFPVQTVVYALMAISLGITGKVTIGSVRKSASKVQVFGDDIILPRENLDRLREMLTFFGLKVNDDKTFGGANFRESCGVDAFQGHDVSPVYIKHFAEEKSPFSKVSSYVAHANNLYLAGLWNAANGYRERIGLGSLIPTVPFDSGKFGFVSYQTKDLPLPGKIRWNADLMRHEFRCIRSDAQKSDFQTSHPAQLLDWFLAREREGDRPKSTDVLKEVGKPHLLTGMRARQQDSQHLRVGWEPVPAYSKVPERIQ